MDIHNLQQKEADKCKAINERYHTLLNAMMPDFIFIFNKDFTFHEIILPEGLKLFDDPDQLIGISARAIYSPEVSELFISNINDVLQNGGLKSIEYHVDLLGNRYYYQARIVPFEGDKAFALIHDISDRVRRMNDLIEARRQAEEVGRMKSSFLANMSHEIRTPLNAIVGFTEVIAMEDDPENKAEYMQIIRANNELLLQLINDILDLSRIESGKSEMHFETTNVNNLIHEIEQVQQIKMPPSVELKIIIPSDNIWITTDNNRVKQILFNFLSNATKNTEKGSITLGVEVNTDSIRFFVADTGCGIPEDKLRKIFDRFEKINDHVQGTGLGLSICSNLVERLGGSIAVESVIGEGSTFSFTLPYQKKNNVYPGTSILKEIKPSGKSKILIAEDSEESYKHAAEIVKDKFEPIWAKNGQEAVNLFILEKPTIILMSIQMPVMDGIESAKKIRSISQAVPIIGFVSNNFYIEQKWAMDSGYNDVIQKPYTSTMLMETIAAFV